VNTPKTRIQILGLPVVGLLAVALLAGCSSSKPTAFVPTRNDPNPALVLSGDFDGSEFAGRDDARLGLNREVTVRTPIVSNAWTYDRQRIIDGRPYVDFRVTTRTFERLQH